MPGRTQPKPTGSLATPTDAYKTAYDLRKKKDIEGLKKVMTKDILDFLKMMGEDDKKSLDDMLREMVALVGRQWTLKRSVTTGRSALRKAQ